MGLTYENMAVDFLKDKGYKILKRNYRTRQGEIDIVAALGNMLVFVEVKYRSSARCGYPEEAVTPAKCKKISKTALQYLNYAGISLDTPVRFDVISIINNDIRHIINAFDYAG